MGMGTRRSLAAGIAAALWSLATVGSLATRPPAGDTFQASAVVQLPNRPGSFKFAVLGDFGTGDRTQYQLGEEMAKLRARFPYRDRDHRGGQHLRW